MEGRLTLLAEKINDIAITVKELKQLQMEQMKSDIVDHQILLDHERRSTQLETRILPLEQDWVFRSRLWKLVGSGGLLTIIIEAWLRLH